MTDILIGGRPIKPAASSISRMTVLLWGSAGTGKTTLASTMPGKKLIINFDPDGYASVSGRDDVDVIDLSDTPHSIVDQFKSQDPLGLAKVIDAYDTLIFDSLTNIGFKTEMQGIAVTKGATIERPSPGAYGVRSALIVQLVKNILALTAKKQKHVCFIAHEDAPVTDDNGAVMHITLSLGGKLPEKTALDFSEVWCVQDMGAGRNRRIMVRPARNRKPMKTRMFVTDGEPEFEWVYSPDTNQGMKIADWFEAWKNNDMKKLPLPKGLKS